MPTDTPTPACPLDFLYGHYRMLQQMGFAEIEDSPTIQQLIGYAWDLVDRCKAKELPWEDFEDAVQRWFLFMADKLEARRAFPVGI